MKKVQPRYPRVAAHRLREQSVLYLLGLGRRAFANTRLNRWQVSSAAKRYLMAFGFGRAERTVDLEGAKLIVQLDEVASAPAILAGSYEALSLKVFRELASRAKVVLDVGGGQGMYAVVAGKAMAKGGTVLCFEPVPENQELIRRNIALNDLENTVVVSELALADSRGLATVYLAPGNSGGHSLSSGVARSTRSIQIQTETADRVILERQIPSVDLMKIDVEGFEDAVIAGAEATIESSRPALLFELVPTIARDAGRDPSKTIELLEGVYNHFFLIDEVRSTMVRFPPRELVRAASGRASVNVVAVSRAEHIEIAEAVASTRIA
jgi:FkbM family methyltransferase